MTNLQQLFKNQDKEFEETDLTHIIQTGHSIHGSSYSHQELDPVKVKSFFHSSRLAILQEIDKMCEEMKKNIPFGNAIGEIKTLGYNSTLSSLQSEIKKLIEL